MPAPKQSQAAQQPGDLSWLLNLLNPIGTAQAAEEPAEPPERRSAEPTESAELEPGEAMRVGRFKAAWEALKRLDPKSRALEGLKALGALPTELEIEILERAAREIVAARACTPTTPTGLPDEPDPEPLSLSRPLNPYVARLELPRADPRASQRLVNALANYETRRYTIDNQVFQFDKSGMRDVLTRHALEYWDGEAANIQSLFPRGTTIDEIQDIVGDILSQNRDSIIADPSQYQWKLLGMSHGGRYEVATYQGRIRHVVPLQ